MKRAFYLIIITAFLLVTSCSTSKKTTSEVNQGVTTAKSLEGEKVQVETLKMQGIEMAQSLNEDGTGMIEIPYKWYAGIGKANNKQVAIELAQREAYATISRIIRNAVMDKSERGNVTVNGNVQQALLAYWEQISTSLQQGCEPFGNVTVEYSKTTGMYNVVAKVGIRGDRFNEMINSAGSYTPKDLKGEELEQFIEVNKTIMDAAKGN